MTTDKHEVLLRMRAIELLAYWEGRLVTNRLMSWFGLSRQQASADIKRYNTLCKVVFKKLCHFLKLLKTGMMHYGNYI